MTNEKRLTRHAKRYDKDLIVKRLDDGKLYCMRNTIKWDSYLIDGQVFHCSQVLAVPVFAITSDWTSRGFPIDCGVERLMCRLKEIDTHRSEEIINRINNDYHEAMESKEKLEDHNREAFCKEVQTAVKLDFKDFSVSSMKTVDPRVKLEKKLKLKGL